MGADLPRETDRPERVWSEAAVPVDVPVPEPSGPMAKLAYESVDRALAERKAADAEALAEQDRPDWRTDQADAPQGPERADRPQEATRPSIATDYYPTIPPTVDDRYFVRDQANPIPIFDGPPRREEANQGAVGDCGIVATLGAVAGHRPDAIQNAIRPTGDGRYEVTLHEVVPATPANPVARPTGDTVTYKMNDQIPVRTDLPTRPPAAMDVDKSGWAAIIEKAVASQDQTWDAKQRADWDRAWTNQYKRVVDQERRAEGLPSSPNDAPTGYNRIDMGSTAHQRANLLAELTGEAGEVRSISGEEHGERALLDEFRSQIDAGKPVLVGSRHRLGNEAYPFSRTVFDFGHAYEVTKIEGDKIQLRNPWGVDEFGNSSDPPPMDVKTFWEYYRHHNLNGSRTGYYSTLK